jgi:hypothetical protein
VPDRIRRRASKGPVGGSQLVVGKPEGDTTGHNYTRTPFVKRLPTVASLVAALVVARIFGHALWSGLLLFIATIIVCVVVLHFVFRQPLDRILSYKEFDE